MTDGIAEHDYCVLESLTAYSAATDELLEVLQTIVKRHADEVGASKAEDIVHFDFSPANAPVDHWLTYARALVASMESTSK